MAAAASASSIYRPAPYHAPAPYHPAPAPYHPAPSYKASPAVYNYGYAVKDDYSGVDFSANEERNGYATNGGYSVLLPDGRRQVRVTGRKRHTTVSKITDFCKVVTHHSFENNVLTKKKKKNKETPTYFSLSLQIVTYHVADDYSGYVADVKYEGYAQPYHAPAPVHAPYHPAPAPYHPAPYQG